MCYLLSLFKKRYLFPVFFLFFAVAFCLFYQPSHTLDETTYCVEEKETQLFLNALESSQKFVWMGAYKLHQNIRNDARILDRLTQLSKRGVLTFVFLESRLSKEEKRSSTKNKAKHPSNSLTSSFESTGAHVISNLQNFNNVHFKCFLSEQHLILGTTNFDGNEKHAIARDFFIVSKNSSLMKQFKDIAEKLKNNQLIQWESYSVTSIGKRETKLSWGPYQHKKHLLELIHLAKKSIHIYQQDLQEPSIRDELIKKIKKGISVKILMSYHPFSEKFPNKNIPNLKKITSSGGCIRLTGKTKYKNNLPLHIHAKVLLVDSETNTPIMYLGSANFYPNVLNKSAKNLNVGVITTNKNYIDPVTKVFNTDWLLHHEHQMH